MPEKRRARNVIRLRPIYLGFRERRTANGRTDEELEAENEELRKGKEFRDGVKAAEFLAGAMKKMATNHNP